MFHKNFFKLIRNRRLFYCSLKQILNFLKKNSPFIKFTSAVVDHSTIKDSSITADKYKYKYVFVNFKAYFQEYFLNNIGVYDSYVDTQNISWGNDKNFESFKLFKNFINNREDKELQQKLEKSIKNEISLYDLEDILKYVAMLKKCFISRSTDKEIEKLIKYLDEELLQRKLSHKDAFKVLHVCCELPCSLKFVYKKTFKFYMNCLKLNPKQVVELMYCRIKLRKVILKSLKYDFQSLVVNNISKFNSDELGIVAAGMMKGKLSFIHKDIAPSIINKTIEEIENMHMIPFYCICQCLCLFLHPTHIKELANFQERVIPHAAKLKGSCLIALVRTGLKLRFIDPSLWEILANNFKREINNYYLNQIKSFVEAMTVYNIHDEELLHLAIKQFEAAENSSGTLILFLSHLVHHQLYPKNLLSRVLSKDFKIKFNLTRSFISTQRNYLFLVNSVEVEKPTYNFESITDEERKIFFKKILHRIYKHDTVFAKNVKLQKILQDIYGESPVYSSRFIPDYQHGIIMRFDKNLKAQPIPEAFKMIKTFKIKRPLRDDHFWIFLKVISKNQTISGTNSLSFEFQTQIRLLKILGFKPVMVPDFWNKKSNQNTVADCVKDLISHSLQELQHEEQNKKKLI